MRLERECDVYKLPIFLNRQGTHWGLFWFAFRHPRWWTICDGSGIWFMSQFRSCVDYELMECGNEMCREDLYAMRVARA